MPEGWAAHEKASAAHRRGPARRSNSAALEFGCGRSADRPIKLPSNARFRADGARELLEPFRPLSGRELAGYSAASCRVPPSHAVTTSSATAPGGSALMPTSVQVG